MTGARVDEGVRYEPHENPPPLIAAGAGIQAAMIIVAPMVLTVFIVARIAEQPESYLSWAVFAALLISGITTVLQAVRVGRVGAGHVLIMGTSGAFIAVCVTALAQGGPATMASLIIVSSLFQFEMLASRLSLLRRIFTPVVTGTVIMLIAVTVMPIVFDTLVDVPDGAPRAAAPAAALATLITVSALVLRGPSAWRLWSPLIGIVVGCSVAAAFGLYDVQYILEAPWFGAPVGSWPGFDLTPGVEFWALLPAFVVVTLVGAIETVGDGVAIQRVSQRRPRATDFRVVQGALNADGTERLVLVGEETLSNLLTEAEEGDEAREGEARRLIVIARPDGRGAELEFISASGGENLEDRLAYLGETPDISDGREMSFRLLRHYASSVRHQKYHGVDIVTVNVEGSL